MCRLTEFACFPLLAFALIWRVYKQVRGTVFLDWTSNASWTQIRDSRIDIFRAHSFACIFQAREIKNYSIFRFVLWGSKQYAVMSSLTTFSQHLCSWHSCAVSEQQGKLLKIPYSVTTLPVVTYISFNLQLAHVSLWDTAVTCLPALRCLNSFISLQHTQIRISWLFRNLCDPQVHCAAYRSTGLGSY